MEQRATFVTVSTRDLEATAAFYTDGLGWTALLEVPDEVVFFQVGPGLVFGLFEAAKFAEDIRSAPADPAGFTLANNVSEPAEVDRILSAAVAAGGRIVKPAQHAAFGGYHGHFADPNGTVWEIAHNPGWRVTDDGTVVFSDHSGGGR